jgi:hypothetical protein
MLCRVVLLLGEVEDSSAQCKSDALFCDGCFGAAWASERRATPGAYKQCAVLAFRAAQSYAFLFQPALSRLLSAVASDMRTSAAAPPLELVALSDSWLVGAVGGCTEFICSAPACGRLGRS